MFWIVRCPELLSASQCVITGHWNCSEAVRVRFTALAEDQKKGHRLDAATVQIEMRGPKKDHSGGSGCCSQCCWSGSYDRRVHFSGKHLHPVRTWQVKGICFATHWEWSGGWDPRGSPGLGFEATASVFLPKSRSPYTDLRGRKAWCPPALPVPQLPRGPGAEGWLSAGSLPSQPPRGWTSSVRQWLWLSCHIQSSIHSCCYGRFSKVNKSKWCGPASMSLHDYLIFTLHAFFIVLITLQLLQEWVLASLSHTA